MHKHMELEREGERCKHTHLDMVVMTLPLIIPCVNVSDSDNVPANVNDNTFDFYAHMRFHVFASSSIHVSGDPL